MNSEPSPGISHEATVSGCSFLASGSSVRAWRPIQCQTEKMSALWASVCFHIAGSVAPNVSVPPCLNWLLAPDGLDEALDELEPPPDFPRQAASAAPAPAAPVV